MLAVAESRCCTFQVIIVGWIAHSELTCTCCMCDECCAQDIHCCAHILGVGAQISAGNISNVDFDRHRN